MTCERFTGWMSGCYAIACAFFADIYGAGTFYVRAPSQASVITVDEGRHE